MALTLGDRGEKLYSETPLLYFGLTFSLYRLVYVQVVL